MPVWLMLLLVLCLPPAAAQEAERPPAQDLREETLRFSVTVKDLYGRSETRSIGAALYRPRGDGPFPLVVFNHGRATTDKRATQGRSRPEQLARWLAAKGFAVIAPTRVGYADTYGDFDPESSGSCQQPRLEPVHQAASDQVLAAVEHAKTLPYVDTSRWLVMGVSVGGLTSVATVARQPAGLLGGINFVGGIGGDPERNPGRPCAPHQVASLWGKLAASAKAPMLWLYWENDKYWGPDIPRQWHKAWADGGGQAEFHLLGAVGDDGHAGLGRDMDRWAPLAEAFLARLGFGASGIPARPPATSFAALDEVDKVPVSAANRDNHVRRFLQAAKPRALAVGERGAVGWATGDWALGRALGNCERTGQRCRLYAVDDEVVW